MSKQAKTAAPTITHAMTPERTECPHCGGPARADYTNRRTIHTLAGVTTTLAGILVRGGGTLTLSNAVGIALNNSAPVTLGGLGFGGGTLSATLSETIGTLNVGVGASTISTANTQTLIINALGTRSIGGTLNFTNTGTNNFAAPPPALTNSLIGGWATFNGFTFASLNLSNSVNANPTETLVSTNLDPNAWVSTDNILFDAAATPNLTTSITVNSLRSSLATNITPLTMSGSGALAIGTGGIIGANQSNVRSFNGGSISATGNELFVHVGGFTFNSQIALGASGVLTIANASGTTRTTTLSNATNTIGDIYINGANAVLASAINGALGADGTIYLNGGTLSTGTTGQVISKSLNVAVIGGTIGGGGGFTSEYSGLVTLNGNLNINPTSSNNNVIKLSNTISGSGAITGSTASANGVTMFLDLTGSNSYAGGTTLSQQTSQGGALVLRIGNNNALGTGTLTVGNSAKGIRIDPVSGSGALVIPNAIISSANHASNYAFAFQSGSLTDNLTFTGPVSIGTGIGANIIDTINSTTQVTFSGALSGTSGLNKIRDGVLQLSGPSTYTGTTTLYTGTLLIGGNAPVSANGALGNSNTAVIVGSNTALPGSYTGNDTGVTGLTAVNRITQTADNLALLTSAAISIDRSVTVGNLNTTGTTTLGGNSANSSVFSGAIALSKDVILTQVSGGTVSFNGAISGTGFGITKTGTGTVALGAANQYTGATIVNAGGPLRLDVDGALPNGSATTLNGGTLAVAAGTTNGSAGGGVLTVSAASTIDFGGAASPTTLSFGNTSGTTLTAPLVITGYTGQGLGLTGAPTTRLFIGGSNILTGPELLLITFNGYDMGGSSTQLGSGEVVPLGVVPEPGTILGLAAMGLGLGNWVRRRRLVRQGAQSLPA